MASTDRGPRALRLPTRSYTLIDAYRKGRREVLDLDEPGASEPPCPGASALAITGSREMLRRIEAELQHLSDTNRVAFELVKLDGLDIAEVAEMLGTTEQSVRLRVHRALEALRDKLGEDPQWQLAVEH